MVDASSDLSAHSPQWQANAFVNLKHVIVCYKEFGSSKSNTKGYTLYVVIEVDAGTGISSDAHC